MPMEITYTEKLVVTSCWCGINLAIPGDLYSYARSKPHTIYCPLGHAFTYNNTYKEQAERERKRAQANLELLHAEERSHTATRGHLTRQKKRIANGVCPCCKRSFANLHRHMAAKHPDFAETS